MKNILSFLLLLIIFSLIFEVNAQKISTNIINLTETQNQISVDFALSEYEVVDTSFSELYGNNTQFSYISVSNDRFGKTWDEGYPCLPQLTVNLSVPNGASNFNLTCSNIIADTFYLSHPILPSQEDLYDSLPFTMNESYYQSNGLMFSDTAVLSEEYYYMSKEGISLTIFPFIYNPILNRVIVIKSGTFMVSYNLPTSAISNEISEVKELVIENFFQNYSMSQNGNRSNLTFLIITDPMYESALSYYVNYKRNLGFDVTLATTTGNTGTSASDIKDYIDWRFPDFVLLVGDVNQVPTYGTLDGSDDWDPATDLEYTRLDGNDFFPDVFLGRFSVSSIPELQNICNKNIFMEMNRQQFDEKVKLVAAEGQNNWWTSHFEEGHNYVVNNYFNPLSYISDKLYESNGASTTDIYNALSDNPIFCLYSGHGNYDYSFLFYMNNIDADHYSNSSFPLAFSFACYTGNFGVDECFGEKWIRSLSGGVSYFGCSVHSLVEPDIKLEKSIFMDYSALLGQMIDMGKIFFWNSYHSSTNNRRWKRYMRSYNLLGDPTFNYKGIGCKNEYIFSNNEIIHNNEQVYYRATDRIVAAANGSTYLIQNGANVNFFAGNEIVLNPGFTAENGSTFNAVIEPCISMSLKSNIISGSNNSNENSSLKTNNKTLNNNEIKVFPNPFNDKFNANYFLNTEGKVIIEIFDVLGNKINYSQLKGIKGNNTYLYDGSNLVNGIYLFKITTPEFKKVIVLLKN